jgi:hypothetical protein
MFSAACSLLLCTLPAAPPADVADTVGRLDALMADWWQAEKVTPEAPADDATFLRRAWLDLAGRVPPALPARDFLDDRDPARRGRLVEALLAGDDFADHWGRLLTISWTAKRPVRQEKYEGGILHEYLRDALKQGKSYRAVVRELLTGAGMSDQSGPANFLLRYDAKPTDLAGAVGKHFLGISLECAQCHDHPFAPWKEQDFWGVAAFFGRLRAFEHDGEEETYRAVLEARRGELQRPDPMAKPGEDGKVPRKTIKPRWLLAPDRTFPEPRRQSLADWVTAADNLYFARNAVNRAWAQLFGTGLVPPLDRLAPQPESKPHAVLTLLAEDFASHGHDLRRLLRVLASSRAYQLGTGTTPAATDTQAVDHHDRQRRTFARFGVRPLSVDQLHASLVQATGHREEEMASEPKEGARLRDEGFDDPAVEGLGERAMTVPRALALLNSGYVNEAVQAGAKVAQTANGNRPGAAHVEYLFLATLSRRPTPDEAAPLLDLLRSGKDNRGLQDVLWVLINSAEFLTNH